MTTDNDKLLTQPCPHKDPDSDGYCHNCEGTMMVLTPLGSEVAAMIRQAVDRATEKLADVRDRQDEALGRELRALRDRIERCD